MSTIMKYKAYENGKMLFGIPFNGYGISIYYKARNVFHPKVIARKAFDIIFGNSREINLEPKEKHMIGELYGDVKLYGGKINTGDYEGNGIISARLENLYKMLKPHIKKISKHGMKMKNHINKRGE